MESFALADGLLSSDAMRWASGGLISGLSGASVLATLIVWAKPFTPAPFDLALESEGGQVRIAWSPETRGRALLEILDGAARIRIPVGGALANICYAPRTRNVAVRLIGLSGRFEARFEIPRLSGDRDDPSIREIAGRFDQTESKVNRMRAVLAGRGRRIAVLERSADMVSAAVRRLGAPPAQPVFQRFWRP